MDLVYVGFVDICTSSLSKLLCTPLFYINAESAETGNDAGLDHDLDFRFDLCFDMFSFSCGAVTSDMTAKKREAWMFTA